MIFSIIFGRTDLRTDVSGAKFDDEADFEVRLPPAAPKPHENCKKQIFQSNFFVEKVFLMSKNKTTGIIRTRFPKFGGCMGHVCRVKF